TPKLTFMILFFSLAFVDGSYADYNNPTSDADCNMYSDRYDFSSKKNGIFAKAQQCLRNLSSREIISGAGVRTSCWGTHHPRCAPLYEQHCEIERHMKSLGSMCRARLQTHQAREREKKLAEDQAKRERDKFLL